MLECEAWQGTAQAVLWTVRGKSKSGEFLTLVHRVDPGGLICSMICEPRICPPALDQASKEQRDTPPQHLRGSTTGRGVDTAQRCIYAQVQNPQNHTVSLRGAVVPELKQSQTWQGSGEASQASRTQN